MKQLAPANLAKVHLPLQKVLQVATQPQDPGDHPGVNLSEPRDQTLPVTNPPIILKTPLGQQATIEGL